MEYMELGVMSIKLIEHQVIPLWKSVKQAKLVCSFINGFIIPIKNASRFFLIRLLDGALHNMDQGKKYSICLYILCWS